MLIIGILKNDPEILSPLDAMAGTTTIYFDRLETVCFFRLSIREGDMEYTDSSNTDHRGI